MSTSRTFLLVAVSVIVTEIAMTTEQNPMDDACKKEVIELHQFFWRGCGLQKFH